MIRQLCVTMLTSLLLVGTSASTPAQSLPEELGPTGPVEKLGGDFQFTEGPAVDEEGVLYFTDIPANRIYRWTEADGFEVFVEPSGHANGLMWTPGTGMVVCQMDGSLARLDLKERTFETLADAYKGNRFNAPNDLVVDSTGGIYFTDPLYRAPQPLPQGTMGVYYRSAAGQVSQVIADLPAPNGILLAPDEKTLYVIPSQDSKIRAYPVTEPGQLGTEAIFASMKQGEGSDGKQGGDGGTIDTQGNLYVTTGLGVQVFSPEGKLLGIIEFPEHPANVTFGGKDFRSLIVTARTSVYRVPMAAQGHRYRGTQ